MALTDAAIRAAKPQAKAYKPADEKGLFLLVSPSGGLLWRLKSRVNGVEEGGHPKRIERLLSLGAYPAVSLNMDRERRDEARGSRLTALILPSKSNRPGKRRGRPPFRPLWWSPVTVSRRVVERT